MEVNIHSKVKQYPVMNCRNCRTECYYATNYNVYSGDILCDNCYNKRKYMFDNPICHKCEIVREPRETMGNVGCAYYCKKCKIQHDKEVIFRREMNKICDEACGLYKKAKPLR